ncbi:MAG TPA: hypothetical protein VMT62_05305 [Syntrophorhabdaceae bacterium]|nr:hypothetical protein [Syntrophorhabdaceae bacterium]
MKRKLIFLVLILMVFGLLAVTFAAEPHIPGGNSSGATDHKRAVSTAERAHETARGGVLWLTNK